MTRYDKTAPSSSEFLPPLSSVSFSEDQINEDQINLVKVRPGLTPFSQTRLTDFKLYPTPYGLEIHLPVHRLRGSLISAALQDSAAETTWLSLRAVGVMTLLVGGAVVLTSSPVFGAIIAGVLPAVLWLIGSSEAPRQSDLVLRLVNSPDGRMFLSLSTSHTASHTTSHTTFHTESRSLRRYSPHTQLSHSSIAKSKSTVYLSNLPVKLVSAKTTSLGGQVIFTLYPSNPLEDDQLYIRGNRQEVRWLHARIAHWGKGSSRYANQNSN